MRYPDPLIQVALERLAERVRVVRAVGEAQPAPAWTSDQAAGHPARGRTARRRLALLAVVVLLLAAALGSGGWLFALAG